MLQTEMIFAFMTFDVVKLEFKNQLTSHFLHDSRLMKSVKFIFITSSGKLIQCNVFFIVSLIASSSRDGIQASPLPSEEEDVRPLGR